MENVEDVLCIILMERKRCCHALIELGDPTILNKNIHVVDPVVFHCTNLFLLDVVSLHIQGSAAKGSLSKEDAAVICVEAINTVPQTGFILEVRKSICLYSFIVCKSFQQLDHQEKSDFFNLQVVNGDEKVSDWNERLSQLMERAGEEQP